MIALGVVESEEEETKCCLEGSQAARGATEENDSGYSIDSISEVPVDAVSSVEGGRQT